MIFSPITEIAHLIPLVGEIIGIGAAAAALLLSVAISMVTISIAWITYRPLLGGAMLAGAIAWFVLIKHHGARKTASRRQA
jgi:hypothetical protein